MPYGAAVNKRESETLKAIEAILALSEVAEYFDQRADVVDGDYGIPEPNEEMRLGMIVSAAIIAAVNIKGIGHE